MNKINIRQLFDYDSWTYTYLLWCIQSKECILIDCVLGQVERDLDIIDKLDLKLKYLFETHVHADHITGANLIKNKRNVEICYGSKTGVDGADLYLADNEKILLGKFPITAIHTPGHTSGCTSYYIDGFIFTGDTLFINGTGRTDFQEGSSESTFNSVRNKIFTLPDNTIVYPAHNYNGLTCSTILEEKQSNPNVGLHVSKETFIKNEKNKKRSYPKKFDIAVPANMKCGLKK